MKDPVRVLIVDDEENILWSFERALTHEGFRVRRATNVAEARAVLLSEDIQVTVTDLRLPGEDGMDLLRWARDHRPGMQTIITTAFGSSAVRQDALRQGAVHYLEKPVDIATLCALVRRCADPLAAEPDPPSANLFAVDEKPSAPPALNTDDAVEIAPGIHWVGHRNPRSLLQCNVFLRVFRGGPQPIHMLIDPGSPLDLPVISKKVGQVIGDIRAINLFSVNHQDPDVVANAVFIQRMNPRAICIATEDTWRLIAHYELDPARVRLVEKFKDGQMKLQSGHVMSFLPTPFCHFRGAVAIYDRETRVLFTGDLFGGLSPSQHRDLWVTEASWDGVKAFHQIYMPSNKVLQRAVASIRALDPKPEIIAPQHGDLLRGPLLDDFLSRVARLPVGADLFEDTRSPETLGLLRDAANDLLDFATGLLGKETVARKIGAPVARGEIATHAALSGTRVTAALAEGPELLSAIEGALSRDESYEIANQLRMTAIKAQVQRGLPISTGKLEGDDEILAEPAEDFIR